MPTDPPVDPEAASDAIRAHVDKLAADAGGFLSPADLRRLEGESEASIRSCDPDDLRIRGVKYVDENGERVDPSRVRPVYGDADA